MAGSEWMSDPIVGAPMRALALLLSGCAATVPLVARLPIDEDEDEGPAAHAATSAPDGISWSPSTVTLANRALARLRVARLLHFEPPPLAFEPTLGPAEPAGPHAVRTTCYTHLGLPYRDEICVTALGAYREGEGTWRFVAAIPLETREVNDWPVPAGVTDRCGYRTTISTRWVVFASPTCLEIREVRSFLTTGSWCEDAPPHPYCRTGFPSRFGDVPTELPPTSTWFSYARGIVPDLRGAWHLADDTWRRTERCDGPLSLVELDPHPLGTP